MSLDSEGLIEVPGVTSHYVRLSDGSKAHFSTAGHDGPAIILCHGGLPGSSGITFRYALPFLGANGFRVYAPDFPGFGYADTSRPEYYRGGPGSPVHIDFLQRFADALCLDQFSITGNSMGCGNTLQYVLAHPERVKNFVLLAGTVGDIATRNHGVVSSMDVRALNQSTFDGSEACMRTVMTGLVQDPASIPDDVVKMRTAAATRQKESYTNQFRTPADPRSQARTTSVNRIDRINIPAVYAWGIDDRMSPVQSGFSDEDAVKNIQFFYPEGAGHALHNDIPEVVNNFLLEFFRDNKVSWKTAEAMGVSRRRAIDPTYVEEPAGGFPTPMPEAYNNLATLKESLAKAPVGAR